MHMSMTNTVKVYHFKGGERVVAPSPLQCDANMVIMSSILFFLFSFLARTGGLTFSVCNKRKDVSIM